MRRKHIVSFGSVISDARNKRNLNLRECALMILKEDGKPISYQYLNDLETGRRKPPSDYIIEQIATVLNIPIDVLYFHADRFPPNINTQVSDEKIIAAFKSFRSIIS